MAGSWGNGPGLVVRTSGGFVSPFSTKTPYVWFSATKVDNELTGNVADFNASRSSEAYGKSGTVQPKSFRTISVVRT